MSNVRFELQGADKLAARLRKSRSKADDLLEDALMKVAEKDIFPETQRQVPVETGALRATGRVELVDGAAAITYGGGPVVYAMIQHERLDYNHPRGGKAKFVEDPVVEAAPRMTRLLQKYIGSGGDRLLGD